MAKTPTSGPVETAVRNDIKDLGDLVGMEPTLAALAVRIANEIDAGEDAKQLAANGKELRATLKQLADGRGEDEHDDFGDLAAPA